MSVALAKRVRGVPTLENVSDPSFEDTKEAKEATSSIHSTDSTPLGVPQQEKRFWWQRGKEYDPGAIATQVNSSYGSTP
jgi:hypothetical protein